MSLTGQPSLPKGRYLMSSILPGNARSCASAPCLRGAVREPQDDELRGPQGGDADLGDQTAVEDVVLGHRGAVALDEESLPLDAAGERARPPLCAQEEAKRVWHAP